MLAVGAGLGYFATDNGALLRGKSVIQVDLDPPGVSEGVRAATSYVRGDAALAVAAIDAALGRATRRPASAPTRRPRGSRARCPSTPSSRPSPAPSTPRP